MDVNDLWMPADAAITYDLGSRYIMRRESCPTHEIAGSARAVPLTGSIRWWLWMDHGHSVAETSWLMPAIGKPIVSGR